MDSGKIFWIYQSNKYPTIIAFEKKQPEYLMTGYSEYKCISSNKDLDSYIYFLQHTHDITVKELKTERDELKAKLEEFVEALEFYADDAKWNVLKDFDIDLRGFDLGDDEGFKAQKVLKSWQSFTSGGGE